MTDWVRWHEQYDQPGSSLDQRLQVVRRRIADALEALDALDAARAHRVLALCAGDGRDILSVLAGRPGGAGHQPATRLVELDPFLAERARARAAAVDHDLKRVDVVTGDAGDPTSFADHSPVHLLLLCGIFGNVSEADIRTTLDATPSMLVPGGFAIWTRGDREPDLRPAIRSWCAEGGLAEVAFDGSPARFGVGMVRAGPDRRPPRPLPDRLFTFVQ